MIVDGTHRQGERRGAVRQIAAAHGMPTLIVVVIASLEQCLARQSRRGRRVPAADITRQHAAIQQVLPSLLDEGYAAVVCVDTTGVARPVTA